MKDETIAKLEKYGMSQIEKASTYDYEDEKIRDIVHKQGMDALQLVHDIEKNKPSLWDRCITVGEKFVLPVFGFIGSTLVGVWIMNWEKDNVEGYSPQKAYANEASRKIFRFGKK